MATTTVSDAVVFPQDDGTGVPADDEDYNSAGYFGLLARYLDGAYVGSGLGFTVDTAADEVTVGAGHAFVEDGGVSVQSGSQTTYDTTLPDDIVELISLPTSVTLSLDVDAVNDVYLAHDPTANDSVYFEHGNGISAPTDPHVLLGTVATANGETTRANPFPVSYHTGGSVEFANGIAISGTVDDFESAIGGTISDEPGLMVALSQDGTNGGFVAMSINNGNTEGVFGGYGARGTPSTPSDVQAGDAVAAMRAEGYASDGFYETGVLRWEVDSVNGTDIASVAKLRTREPDGTYVTRFLVGPGNSIRDENEDELARRNQTMARAQELAKR